MLRFRRLKDDIILEARTRNAAHHICMGKKIFIYQGRFSSGHIGSAVFFSLRSGQITFEEPGVHILFLSADRPGEFLSDGVGDGYQGRGGGASGEFDLNSICLIAEDRFSEAVLGFDEVVVNILPAPVFIPKMNRSGELNELKDTAAKVKDLSVFGTFLFCFMAAHIPGIHMRSPPGRVKGTFSQIFFHIVLLIGFEYNHADAIPLLPNGSEYSRYRFQCCRSACRSWPDTVLHGWRFP